MDEIGAYEIPSAAFAASGNYRGGWMSPHAPYFGRTITGTSTLISSWSGSQNWSRTGISYAAPDYENVEATEYHNGDYNQFISMSGTYSQEFTFEKNGNATFFNSSSGQHSGDASGSLGHTGVFASDTYRQDDNRKESYSSSAQGSEVWKLTTSSAAGGGGHYRSTFSSTRQEHVQIRSETTTTVTSTVPTVANSVSTSTSTVFSISTFKLTHSTSSSRYWETTHTSSGTFLGYLISGEDNSEFYFSRSGSTKAGTYSTSFYEEDSSSTSGSYSRFEPTTAYANARHLNLTTPFLTVISSISVLLNDGETYWYVDKTGEWSTPLSKSDTSFTSTYEVVLLNYYLVFVGEDGVENIVYWDENTYNGKVVGVTHTNYSDGTEQTSALTVSGTGSVKSRAASYIDTNLLNNRLTINSFNPSYIVRTTSSSSYAFNREFYTEWLRIFYSDSVDQGSFTTLRTNWEGNNFFSEMRLHTSDITFKGISATTASSSLGMTKWLWALRRAWWHIREPQPALECGFKGAAPWAYINVYLTTDTGFVAPDASASFHTKLPEFGNWDGGTASANLFLGVGMPKLDGTSHTWDGSGHGATNATQRPGHTFSNWCIIPRGMNNFSSCYKRVNGLFASPLQSRQYAILGHTNHPLQFTAVLCDRNENYTLSSSTINANLTSGSPAFPEVSVSSSVVDLEVRVKHSNFFDDSFNVRIFEAVALGEANSVQANEGERWMQAFLKSDATHFVKTNSSTSNTSTTSNTGY